MSVDADSIDWVKAGAMLNQIRADMFHAEHSGLHGAEFAGESLRRLFARIGHNWVTLEEHMHVLGVNRSQDRANGEQAKATLAHLTAEYERKMREAAREFAQAIRVRCNEVTVPSRYRREGVLLAAAWLDGGGKVPP